MRSVRPPPSTWSPPCGLGSDSVSETWGVGHSESGAPGPRVRCPVAPPGSAGMEWWWGGCLRRGWQPL